LVAVCCSRASLSERLSPSFSVFRSANGPALVAAWLTAAPHSSQNLAPDRFSCWHRRHCMPPSGCGPVKVRTASGDASCCWSPGSTAGKSVLTPHHVQNYLSILRRHQPPKHHPTRTRHREQVAIPGWLCGVGG